MTATRAGHRLRAALSTAHPGRELLAGLTLIAIAVPLNIGYAQVAGLPPTTGLYALVVPTVVYVLLASSRQVVAAPDAAAAALVGSSLIGLHSGVDLVTLAAAQAVVGGVLLLAAGWLRLGFLASFLSRPILVGFVGGLAVDILVSQIAKMLGIKLPKGSEFLESVTEVAQHLGTVQGWSALLAAASLIGLVAGRRLLPVVPWPLIVLVGATAVTAAAGLDGRGVAVIGAVPGGMPLPTFPHLSWGLWLAVVPSALALSLITMAEGLLVGRSYAAKRGYEVDPDRDLVAFGGGNVAAGLFGSFTMGSSTSRTAAMDDAGSRTQLPSLVLAVGVTLLLAFGTSLIALVPLPVIGAIVAVAVWRLVGLGELREIRSRSRAEFAIAVACFAAVLLLGPLSGLLLAFVLSLVNLAARAASPAVDVDAITGAHEAGPAEAVVVRFAAPIFFANAARFVDAVDETADRPGVHTVVLDLSAVTEVDVTGGDAMREVLDRLRGRGIDVVYSRVRPDLISDLERAGVLAGVRRYATNSEAITAPPGGDGHPDGPAV